LTVLAFLVAVSAIRLASFTSAINFCLILFRLCSRAFISARNSSIAILYWSTALSKSGVGVGVGFDVGVGFGFDVEVASANEVDGVARSIANPRASAVKSRGFIGK